MKLKFTHTKPENTRLILIFAGWSTGTPLYADITKEGWDTAVAYDYTSIAFPLEEIKRYSTVYLYCWSLGVWAASQVIPGSDITMAFAAAGTENPVSDTLGIPEAVFRGTAENLDERNLLKFRKRMLGPKSPTDVNAIAAGSMPTEDLKAELLAIIERQNRPSRPSICWTRAYITDDDRIFPSHNQQKAWDSAVSEKRCAETFRLKSPHYVEMKAIVDSTIPDLKKVGKRFEDSTPTYDSNASAQASIAERLTETLASKRLPENGKTLELGQGTGLFTRKYAPVLSPAEAWFVDIYPTRHFGIAPKETYAVADAETWLAQNNEQFDTILSASTIQWFRNLRLFFRNAARSLRPGGRLVCSTYLPGTLGILDSFRPSPMLYRDAEEVEQFAKEHFRHVETFRQTISLEFGSAKEALRHLNDTGVGGAFGRFGSLRELVKVLESGTDIITLNFNALYIYCSHSIC